MRLVLSVVVLCVVGACSEPVPYEVRAKTVADELGKRVKPLDESKPPPPLPLPADPGPPDFDPAKVAEESAKVTELVIQDITPGSGPEAVEGRYATVHYRGTLPGGYVFDTSIAPGKRAITFKIGGGQMVPGFEQGVRGMKVGGTRRIIIPARLAYGAKTPDPDNIPPNSALLFDVYLLFVGDRP